MMCTFFVFSIMEKAKKIAPLILQILLGLMFCVSAVLKIFDMDAFEVYIFSYRFFSLNISFLVARAAIIAEFVLGIGLISNCLHKLMWWGSVLMLLGYTLLLGYALYLGRTDNCHCFGDFMQLDPQNSIIKNIVLIVLFLLIYKIPSSHLRYEWLYLIGLVVVSSVALFIVSPPDSLLPNSEDKNIQKEYFDQALHEAPLDSLQLYEGKKVICFFSSGCDYCRLSAQKLSVMQKETGFESGDICFVFMGTTDGVKSFFAETGLEAYPFVIFQNVIQLLKITNGAFPVLVFCNDGEILYEYGFRDMNERKILDYFKE